MAMDNEANEDPRFKTRPMGEDPHPSIPDRGIATGVTDTYGSNLEQGYDKISTGTRSEEMGSVNNGC